MRRIAIVALIFTTATTVAAVYMKETWNRDQDQARSSSTSSIPAKARVGLTHHGLIAQVDTRNRSLEIEENGRQERIFWDDHTLITVAKHRVKPSALAPGATVFVDVQQIEDRLQANLIAVSPPNLSGTAR